MGKLLGGGKTSSSTSSTNSPWEPAQDVLKKILENAGELFDKQGGINSEWINKEIADLTPEMQNALKGLSGDQWKQMYQQSQDAIKQGQSDIGKASGILGNIAEGGANMTGKSINDMAKELYQGELVQNQKAQLAKDVNQGLESQIQGLNQQASAAGNMGSSRAGVAQGVATGKAAEAIAQGSAAIENNAISNAINQAMQAQGTNAGNMLQAGSSLGNLGISGGNLGLGAAQGAQGWLQNNLTAGSILQGHAQGILDNKWMNAVGQNQQGWDQLSKILGIAGGIGGMGGQTTGTSSGSGGGGGALGGIMQGAGGIISGGAQAGWWSDVRLKDNVVLVKESEVKEKDGVEYIIPALYQWDWNDKAKDLFVSEGYNAVPHNGGVLAQDLEQIGLERFVVRISTDIDGLDGFVRVVDYPALIAYVREAGIDVGEA